MRRFIFLVLLSATTFSSAAFSNKTVLMMMPDDFMWPEYAEPYAKYKNAGFTIKVAGKYAGSVNPDRRNKKEFPQSAPVKVDFTFDQVKVENFDAVTFVAGNGAWHDFFPNETVHRIVKDTVSQGKILGLICASTGLLGFVGNFNGEEKPIAEGKRVVGYFRVEGILKRLGKVQFIPGDPKGADAVVDGKLVTGRNPESSSVFADKVIETLAQGGK